MLALNDLVFLLPRLALPPVTPALTYCYFVPEQIFKASLSFY